MFVLSFVSFCLFYLFAYYFIYFSLFSIFLSIISNLTGIIYQMPDRVSAWGWKMHDFRNVAVFTMSRFCLYNSVVIVKMICGLNSFCCNWKKYTVNFFNFWIFSPIVTTRPFPLMKNNIENGREVTIAISPISTAALIDLLFYL